MKSARTFLAVVSLLALFSPAAAADDLTTLSLDELMNIEVVSASKYPQSLLESPSAISIITSEEIEYSPAQNIPELLQYVVGMDGYTKTYTDMDVAARGFAYDETPKMLVAIDGQTVNVVPYGGMQWPTLPLAMRDIERIEVVRGSASSLYGADALVGVINIITRDAKSRTTDAAMSYGERGAGLFGAQVTKRLEGGWNIAVGGSFTQTESKGDAETPDAETVAPNYGLKDWANVYMGTFRLDYDEDNIAFSSVGGYSSDREGYNPSPGDNSIDKSEKQTFYVNNQLTRRIGADRFLVRMAYRNLGQENWKWNGEEYVYKYKVEKGGALDVETQYILSRFEHSTFVGGVSSSYLEASRDIANETPYVYDENDRLYSAFLQEELRLFHNRIGITVGGRFDKWDSLDGVISPKAALNVWAVPSLMNIRISAGSSFRRPAFDENYYYVAWPGGWFKGSAIGAVTEGGETIDGKLLEPERLLAYEAGMRLTPGEATLIDIEGFRHEVENNVGYIVYESTDESLNLGFGNTGDKVTVSGVETEVKRYFTPRVSAFLNYTYQQARILGNDGVEQEWKNAPNHKVSGGFRYLGNVNLDTRFRYVSSVAYQEITSVPVDDYWTIDVAASKEFDGGITAKVSIQNLLDKDRYEYPMYTTIKRKISMALGYDFQ